MQLVQINQQKRYVALFGSTLRQIAAVLHFGELSASFTLEECVVCLN
jgi:hypothetical protein